MENVKNVVYERPGILVLSDAEWQKGSGINIRLKCGEPVDLTATFDEAQIKRSVELQSAIEAGIVRVLSDEEVEEITSQEKVAEDAEIPVGGKVITPDRNSDQFMQRLADFEDKEEKQDEAKNALRITPRRRSFLGSRRERS